MLLIVSGIAAVVTPFARRSLESEVDADRVHYVYAAWLLTLAGLLGITITGDAFNVFVFFEISSLGQYALIAMGRDRRALTASYQYLIMGTIGMTFLLIGIGFLYMMTGTLNMGDLAARLPAVAGTRTVQAAFAFITVGVGLKLAMFPLHLWLPNAYAYAPSAVTVLIAATATKVAVYVLLRFSFTVFDTPPRVWLVLPLALAGMVAPSLVAVFQQDAKRVFAFSSVAQVGYMLLGIALVSQTGLTATLLHLFNHALIKGAMFLALACVAYRVGSTAVAQLDGLGRQMPWTMAAFVVGGLSLIGIPFTAGFVSKWYLVLGALERGWYVPVAIVVGASLIAVVYVWRMVERAYFHPAPAGRAIIEAPLALLVPTWTLALANLYFGVQTDVTVGAATRAARALLGTP